jgi:hypothetical protein
MREVAIMVGAKVVCCPTCESPFLGRRHCRPCHAAIQREFRVDYCDLSPEEKRKAVARCTANTCQKRGHIPVEACENCGATYAEKHHGDYSRPLDVIWLCRACHIDEHKEKAAQQLAA